MVHFVLLLKKDIYVLSIEMCNDIIIETPAISKDLDCKPPIAVSGQGLF